MTGMRRLIAAHFLAVPRRFIRSDATPVVDVGRVLAEQCVTHRVHWKLPPADRTFVCSATAAGMSSRDIRAALGKSASYVRHVHARVARVADPDSRCGGVLTENGTVRFPQERRPGIPASVPLDVGLATLLGYYCAEGCVVSFSQRLRRSADLRARAACTRGAR